jgi:hypothetical protein
LPIGPCLLLLFLFLFLLLSHHHHPFHFLSLLLFPPFLLLLGFLQADREGPPLPYSFDTSRKFSALEDKASEFTEQAQ